MKVRVIRVLEYEFNDLEAMEVDMKNWGVAPICTKAFNQRCTIRSTTMMPYTSDSEPAVEKSNG